MPVLIRVLFPSLRKRTGRLGGKGAPGSARAAVLNYLAGAHAEELSTLLELFLRPMAGCFVKPDGWECAGGSEGEDEGYVLCVLVWCGVAWCGVWAALCIPLFTLPLSPP